MRNLENQVLNHRISGRLKYTQTKHEKAGWYHCLLGASCYGQSTAGMFERKGCKNGGSVFGHGEVTISFRFVVVLWPAFPRLGEPPNIHKKVHPKIEYHLYIWEPHNCR